MLFRQKHEIEKVMEHFITPVSLAFGMLKNEAITEAYIDRLALFPVDVLKKGADYTIAVSAAHRWPSALKCREYCEQFHKRAEPGTEEYENQMKGRPEFPWEKRTRLIDEDVRVYIKNFMDGSLLASQAKREGWEWELEKYLRAAAYVLAQIIHKRPNCGWEPYILFSAEEMQDFATSRDAFNHFMRPHEESVARGVIDISVPASKINQWRQDAAEKKSRVA